MARQAHASAWQWWFWPFAVIAALLAYGCSRGSDGRWIAACLGYGTLGLIYWTLVWSGGRLSLLAALGHGVVLEIAVIAALAVNPQLQEMGGLLNYLIPSFVALLVMVGWLLVLTRSYLKRRAGRLAAGRR